MTTPAHIVEAQVIFEADTALAQDRAINVWHFMSAGGNQPLAVDTAALEANLIDFYTGIHTGSTNAISNFISADRSGIWEIKMYDLEDAKPRAPIRDSFPTAFTTGATAYPSEVSLCLSYQAQRLSGFAQASRRGRLYIGPLSTATGVSTTGIPVTTANGIVATLAAAGTAMAGKSPTTNGFVWCIYSPKFNTGAVVTDGWVDNAFDTQRRRGLKATSRTLWT
jgi:hypothetical protein